MTLAALVLAAGRGSRLRPLTDTTPKPLLDVGSQTLLDAALARVEQVVAPGPATIAVNAHWLADQIVAAVGERAYVSVEQPVALGTAGAVGALRDWLAGRDLLIANGDVWFGVPLDVRAFVAGWQAMSPRLLVVDEPERSDFDGRWRFAGLSLLPGAMAASLPATPSGLYEVVWSRGPIELSPLETPPAGFPRSDRGSGEPVADVYLDCGTPEELARARLLATRGRA